MSFQQKYERIINLNAQTVALVDSGKSYQKSIVETADRALGLIEATLAAKNLPGIEESYQKLLNTLTKDQADMMKSSLEQAFLHGKEDWTASLYKLGQFLTLGSLVPATGVMAISGYLRWSGVLARMQAPIMEIEMVAIQGGRALALVDGIALAEREIMPVARVMEGLAGEAQGAQRVQQATRVVNGLRTSSRWLGRASLATLAVGLVIQGGLAVYDHYEEKNKEAAAQARRNEQDAFDKTTIETLYTSRLYARLYESYLEEMNKQAGIFLAIGVLMSKEQSHEALIPMVEQAAQKAAQNMTEDKVLEYYKNKEAGDDKIWKGNDPTLERIKELHAVQMKRLAEGVHSQ